MSKSPPRQGTEERSMWRAAQDKATGRTYYFNKKTRETTWTKPLEMSDPEERRARIDAQAKQDAFFRDMEENMRRHIKDGFRFADVTPAPDGNSNNGAPSSLSRPRLGTCDFQFLEDSPRISPAPHRIVRTISTVDDLVLEELKRNDSLQDSLSPLVNNGRNNSRDDSGIVFELESSAEFAKIESKQDISSTPYVRRNSTSTLYVESTMSMPDKDATIRCVCTVIRAHMLQAQKSNNEDTGDPKAAVFHDFEYPSNTPFSPPPGIPALSAIIRFFSDIYFKSQMELECIIMSLIYLERLTKETKGVIEVRPNNWKSLVFSTMIMASKVWDDLSMWNADFSQVCPSFNLRRINELELAVLEYLRYSVRVSASDYAKYYFHLRSYSVKLQLTDDLHGLIPLNLSGARRLAMLRTEYESIPQASGPIKQRCASMPDVSEPTTTSRRAGTEQASLEHVLHDSHMHGDGSNTEKHLARK